MEVTAIAPRHAASRDERPGRPPATSRIDLERVALDLFVRNGFAETTVADIAAAAGISRRTFFRYYRSKNDVVWGDFDALLQGMDDWLTGSTADLPLITALKEAVVRFNTVPAEAVPAHRQRMALILYVPALQAHSTLRYADWRGIVASFAARRLGAGGDDFLPRLIGHLALGAAVAAYEQWLKDPSSDLGALLAASFDALGPLMPSADGSPAEP
jgi:mycofactocin system transcriptional regulator